MASICLNSFLLSNQGIGLDVSFAGESWSLPVSGLWEETLTETGGTRKLHTESIRAGPGLEPGTSSLLVLTTITPLTSSHKVKSHPFLESQ